MNWIPFAERRPEEEPVRPIVLAYQDGSILACTISRGWNEAVTNAPTHWSEIEPPGTNINLDEFTAKIAELRRIRLKEENNPQPPKPDPFGNAWYEHQLAIPSSNTVNPRDILIHFQAGWDAAIKWREGQK